MKKILIVDDDRDLRDAMATVLSGKYELKQAEGKSQAKTILQSFRPDLVILDVMMESISSGFDLARQIKKQATPPKILMLTSIDKKQNMDFKSEAGDPEWLPVDAYLTKPVIPQVLLDTINGLGL